MPTTSLSLCAFCCVEGRPIPTELRADALKLQKAMKYDDAEREGKPSYH